MFICYYPIWDEVTGNAKLIVGLQEALSDDDAVVLFAEVEGTDASQVGAITLENVEDMVTPNAVAVGPCKERGQFFFSCIWLAEPRKTHTGEVWAYVFKTDSVDQAARNLFLYRFSWDRVSAEEVNSELSPTNLNIRLEDITSDTLSEIMEQYIHHGTGGYAEYVVNHSIFNVFDLARRGGRIEVQGTTAAEVIEEYVRALLDRQSGR